MIELKLTLDDEETIVNLPTSWDDVTVEQYSQIYKIPTNIGDFKKNVMVASILTGIDIELFWLMFEEDFLKIAEQLDFMTKKIEKESPEFILVEGEKFYLKKDFKKLNLGETASLETLIKESENQLLDLFPQMLCLFLRKKKENGKLENFREHHMERAEMFKKVKMSDVLELFLFFSNTENG
jgi:hypothetical protein